jgi:hypothetical protein
MTLFLTRLPFKTIFITIHNFVILKMNKNSIVIMENKLLTISLSDKIQNSIKIKFFNMIF